MPRQPSTPAKPTVTKSPTAAPLSRQRYAELVRDVQRLAETSDSEGTRAKVVSLWRQGRRIAREHLGESRGYHNSVLRDLARDTQVNLRNLQYAVAFHRAYATCPKHALSWAQYRVLLERVSPEQREHYALLAVNEGLDVRALIQRITLDRPDAPSTTHLPRPTEASYLYGATVVNVVDGDTVDLRIDLGFHTERRGRFRLAHINTPELDTKDGRTARDFVYSRLLPAKTIVVKTQRVDLHGRYVAHLFYSDQDLSLDACFTQGVHLNNELLAEGHAELMLMR